MHPVVNWFSAPNFNTFNPYSQFSSSWMSFYNTDYKGCLLTTTQQQVVNVKLWIGNFLVVMTHSVLSKSLKKGSGKEKKAIIRPLIKCILLHFPSARKLRIRKLQQGCVVKRCIHQVVLSCHTEYRLWIVTNWLLMDQPIKKPYYFPLKT